MNHVAVLDYDQLDNIPSFLEESEYVIAGVVSFEIGKVSLLFANGESMQIDLGYFKDMGITKRNLKDFDLAEDGQNFFLGDNTFDVSLLWERDDDDRIVRSTEYSA